MTQDDFNLYGVLALCAVLIIGGIALKMHNVHECERFGHSSLYCWTSGSN
jgi:hypothetical protein